MDGVGGVGGGVGQVGQGGLYEFYVFHVHLVPTRTTTIHESFVNRLTYGCKPVKKLFRAKLSYICRN